MTMHVQMWTAGCQAGTFQNAECRRREVMGGDSIGFFNDDLFSAAKEKKEREESDRKQQAEQKNAGGIFAKRPSQSSVAGW
jgi:hypothetical protein